MNYAVIKPYDIANGPGVRVSLFVSGCTHHCRDCFNEEAWDFSYGSPFTEAVQEEIFMQLDRDYIAGLTLLGGEPMEPENQRALLPFVTRVRERFPEKTIWCYSGYTFEYLHDVMAETVPETRQLLQLFDVLVDGPFVAELKDLSLQFRGSSNQRILDGKRSEAAGEAVWAEGFEKM